MNSKSTCDIKEFET